MKKIFFSVLLLFAYSAFTCINANAGVTGTVYSTDIGALIDGSPIESYNINDSTYIKAEDLRGYGFDVIWDENARTLSLYVNDSSRRTILPEPSINVKKADIPHLQKRYDVYSTDIKTYLFSDGILKELDARNVDGETLVKLRDLSDTAYVNYDDDKRLAAVEVIKYQLDKLYEGAVDKSELTLGDGVVYTGQVKDGKPNGIGRVYDKSRSDDYQGRVSNMVTTAYYEAGEISGSYYEEGTYQITSGSSQGIYSQTSWGNTSSDYNVLMSDYHVSEGEYCSISNVNTDALRSATGVVCRCVTDKSYVYGIKNTDIYEYTTYTDGDINIEPETEQLPKFERFTAAYDESAVIAENGKQYSLPYSRNYKAAVYAVTDTSAEQTAAQYPDRYISENGTLYEDIHDGKGFKAVDTDVSMADGKNYIVYLKNDGSVWTYRAQFAESSGSVWNDGEDHSKPVKRADGAVYVSSGDSTSFMYIKADGSLWAAGTSYNGEKGFVQPYDGIFDYDEAMNGESVKMGEGFVSCRASGSGDVSLALGSNGDLYAWGRNIADTDSSVRNIVESDEEYILTPVMAAENVKDYLWQHALYIVKEDGTLWFRGKTDYYDDNDKGFGKNAGIKDFQQCTQLYRRTV